MGMHLLARRACILRDHKLEVYAIVVFVESVGCRPAAQVIISCGSTADAGWRCCSVFVGFRAEVPLQSEKVDSIIEAS